MDRKPSEMTRGEAVQDKAENDTLVRYAVMMSKMSVHCGDMCSDELTSQMFTEGVEKLVKAIKKKRSTMTENGNGTVRTSGANDGTTDGNASSAVVYRDPPQSDAASVPLGKRFKSIQEKIASQEKKKK